MSSASGPSTVKAHEGRFKSLDARAERPAGLPLTAGRAAIGHHHGPWGPSARAPRLSARSAPSSPLAPARFALTESGSGVGASGWGTGASTAGAGAPPGDAAIAHTAPPAGPSGVIFRGEGGSRPSGHRAARGGPAGDSGENGKLRRFPFPKGRNTYSSRSLGRRLVIPWGPFSLGRVCKGVRTRGGAR